MKIAQINIPDFGVAWLIHTVPTFKVLHPDWWREKHADRGGKTTFTTSNGVLYDHAVAVTECRIFDKVSLAQHSGFTACAPEDEFIVGVGLKQSLALAVARLKAGARMLTDEDIAAIYNAAFKDPHVGDALRTCYGLSDGNLSLAEFTDNRLQGLSHILLNGFVERKEDRCSDVPVAAEDKA